MNIQFLMRKISSICDKYQLLEEQSGDNFNIFNVINLTTDEVRVHSAFLAELLNPRGSHGQKSQFLDIFLREFSIENFDSASASVKVEQHIGRINEIEGGRIDIDIWDNNGFHIIIENKIYASDQENQLIRYYNYGMKCKEHRLFYLTLNGDMPDEEVSCNYTDGEDKIKLEVEQNYRLLSYRKDIIKWLELCREKAVSKPLLREAISHYINLIKLLTNQSTNQYMNKEIKDELLRPENIRNLSNLKECLRLVEIELQSNFWNLLIKQFSNKGFEVDAQQIQPETIERYYSPSPKNKYYGIEIYFSENKSIRYGIRIDHNIYGGFTCYEDKENRVNDKETYTKYIHFVKKLDSNYQNSKWWLGWKHLRPALNFKSPTKEIFQNLACLEEIVSCMVDEVISEIEEFKKEFDL